jgi:hypothetical protein
MMTPAVKELVRQASLAADALDVYTDSLGRPRFTQEIRAAVEAVKAEEYAQLTGQTCRIEKFEYPEAKR